MLKALYDYAVRYQLTLPVGYVRKTVKAYISLSQEDRFLGIELGDDEPVTAPDIGSLANGKDKSNVLLEKRSVVLPDEASAKSRFFLDALKDGGGEDPRLILCAAALENPETAQAIRSALDQNKVKASDRVTFKVDGASILEGDGVQAWWRRFRSQFQEKREPVSTLCLITGQPTVPVKTTLPIQGLNAVGGHGRGDALICFDKKAFCSYGLEKAENAPVSEEAFSAVKAALDHLLQGAPILGGMKFVHWYDQTLQEEDILSVCDDLWGLSEADRAEWSDTPADPLQQERDARARADQVPKSVASGQILPSLDDIQYHILLLSGVNGRIMVRRYSRGNYKSLRDNLRLWQEDLRLVNSNGTGPLPPCKLSARLFRLLSYQKSDSNIFQRVDKELSGMIPTVLTAILEGGPLPDSVAARALAYIRSRLLAELEDPDRKSPPTLDARACQWLKVWLNRKNRGKGTELMEDYNLSHPKPAYHCGGLMAVYADIQLRAMPEVNAGIIQRYYAAASRTPALVFGQLDRLSKFHLEKLEKPAFFQRRLAQLYSALGDAVPVTLNLEEQSYFALGYYQQWTRLHTKTAPAVQAEQRIEEET